MTPSLIGANAAWILGLMTVLWVASVARRDASLVDPWWSIAFLMVTVRTAVVTGMTAGKALLLTLVAVWAVRLWAHLVLRSRGKPEDPRYAAFRQRYGPGRYWWISFFQVFLLQGTLVLVVSAPLQLAAAAPAPDPLTVFDAAGALVFTAGFAFEAIADRQLQAFRDDPTRRGTVLDGGLWRYTRHPNYFGEAVLWFGFWLCALDRPWGWTTAFAPVLMTYLLVAVSGVAMLDAHLAARKPGYADYVRRTSAFVPRPPKS